MTQPVVEDAFKRLLKIEFFISDPLTASHDARVIAAALLTIAEVLANADDNNADVNDAALAIRDYFGRLPGK